MFQGSKISSVYTLPLDGGMGRGLLHPPPPPLPIIYNVYIVFQSRSQQRWRLMYPRPPGLRRDPLRLRSRTRLNVTWLSHSLQTEFDSDRHRPRPRPRRGPGLVVVLPSVSWSSSV